MPCGDSRRCIFTVFVSTRFDFAPVYTSVVLYILDIALSCDVMMNCTDFSDHCLVSKPMCSPTIFSWPCFLYMFQVQVFDVLVERHRIFWLRYKPKDNVICFDMLFVKYCIFGDLLYYVFCGIINFVNELCNFSRSCAFEHFPIRPNIFRRWLGCDRRLRPCLRMMRGLLWDFWRSYSLGLVYRRPWSAIEVPTSVILRWRGFCNAMGWLIDLQQFTIPRRVDKWKWVIGVLREYWRRRFELIGKIGLTS